MGTKGIIMSMTDNEKWLLSFYRSSEITGALFFGRLSKYIRDDAIRHDLTKHFADESQHAWMWEKCMGDLGVPSLRKTDSYQDRYFEEIGIPVNVMEILAITQVFEKRVIGQYKRHLDLPDLNPVIFTTLQDIMKDEGWHITWIKEALERLEPEYGKDLIEKTLQKYTDADQRVYEQYCKEHEERLQFILGAN